MNTINSKTHINGNLILLIVSILVVTTSLCPQNCADCDKDQTVCFACNPYYQLSVLSQCVSATTIPNCILYGPTSTICFVCQPTYKLVGNKCEKAYEGCVNKNFANEQCFECGFGTKLVQKKCKGSINCQKSQQVCSSCQKGFELLNGKCQDKTEGCQQIDSGSGVCNKCRQGYNMIGFKCISQKTPVYDCYVYNENSECLKCKNGYIAFENQCLLPIQIKSIQQKERTMSQIIAQKKLQYEANVKQEQPKGIVNCQVLDPSNTSQCLICTYGFYPKEKQCLEVSSYCQGHDVTNGKCFACKYGLQLKQGKCIDYNCLIVSQESCSECKPGFAIKQGVCQFKDINCLSSDPNRCLQCKSSYYLHISGVCQTLPFGCKFANIQTGQCLECLQTYKTDFSSGKLQCKQKQKTEETLKIQNCKVVDQVNKICAVCQERFYTSSDRKSCKKVSDLCKQYNSANGNCINCIDKHSLDNSNVNEIKCIPNKQTENGGAIIVIDNQTTKDQNCLTLQQTPQTKEVKCIKCSKRFYVQPTKGNCVPVNALCKEHNQMGHCTACYQGYTIEGTGCRVARSKDPYCSLVDEFGVCQGCFSGYFFNQQTNRCQPLNPLCKVSNNTNGNCLDCYGGYTLSGGICKVFTRDPNCRQYTVNNICQKCSVRFYLIKSDNSCKQISSLCKTYDQITGFCLTCYSGYALEKSTGQCKVSSSVSTSGEEGIDLNCQEKSMNSNGVCQKCYNGFFISEQGLCIIKNPLCKTIDQIGNCLNCYPGYLLDKGNCVIASQLEGTDVNCAKYNPALKVCSECYKGYFVNPNGKCQSYDPLCKVNNQQNGKCKECYSGYILIKQTCNLQNPISSQSQNSDSFCVKSQGQTCLECNTGYYLAKNNVCIIVDSLCKTYSLQDGTCTSCYTGYALIDDGRCIAGLSVYVPFCKQTDQSGHCIQCIDRYYFDVSEDLCKPVSILCQEYDHDTGHCINCISGYVHQKNECIFPAFGIDTFCSFYENSFCISCVNGYFLDVYKCMKIDLRCLRFDHQKNICLQCSSSVPSGPSCI